MTYPYPHRPIKSFQDLEVYQKALAVSVAIAKRIIVGARRDAPENNEIADKLSQCVLSMPVLIASAHSMRFSNPQKAIDTLEETMLNCNLVIVYLEQYRDIFNVGARRDSPEPIEPEFFEEQIKTLLSSRMKIMHLQMSWKKFMGINKNNE